MSRVVVVCSRKEIARPPDSAVDHALVRLGVACALRFDRSLIEAAHVFLAQLEVAAAPASSILERPLSRRWDESAGGSVAALRAEAGRARRTRFGSRSGSASTPPSSPTLGAAWLAAQARLTVVTAHYGALKEWASWTPATADRRAREVELTETVANGYSHPFRGERSADEQRGGRISPPPANRRVKDQRGERDGRERCGGTGQDAVTSKRATA